MNGSKAFEVWKNPPATIIRKYYFFDIQNPNEIQAGTEKPRFRERGPYSYIEKLEKKNIIFHGDDIISFSPVSTIYFEPSLSVGSEDDDTTFLNIPALVSCLFSFIIFLIFKSLIFFKRVYWKNVNAGILIFQQ